MRGFSAFFHNENADLMYADLVRASISFVYSFIISENVIQITWVKNKLNFRRVSNIF